jgi:hypothetical protein
MDVELTAEESAAVNAALRSYVSDLRMEITDTDNPEYRRTLRAERAALESALAKLDKTAAQPVGAAAVDAAANAAPPTPTAPDDTALTRDGGAWTIVRMWWSRQIPRG